ncbi:CHAT domain-containing protein [Pseudaquabacterium terrae]|nr:CHAT domain-containing protein [Aquabacterium terrae]
MLPASSTLPDDDAGGSEFEPFDVTISLGPEGLPWLSAQSSAGFVHGIPRRDAALPSLDELLDLVWDYADAIAFAEPEPNPELAAHLKTLVFGDQMVVQLFQATRGIAADRRRKILFRVLASPHLAALPWELLPDPIAPPQPLAPRFLALAPDVQIVRQARGRSYSSRPRTVRPPLHLLLVLSSPRFAADQEGRHEFDVFEVKRSLLAELAPLQRAGLLEVDVEDRPTVDRLRRRIASRPRGYHVFHYVGHALPDQLILEDDGGHALEVESARLIELLRLCPDLRLAIFAGCETARARDDPLAFAKDAAVGWRDLLSLADRCVQGACPIVIGMQAVLPLTTERVFTRYLYQGLASGYSVVDALRIARGAVHGDPRHGSLLLDWSVPVLFVGGEDPGPLLPRGALPQPVEEVRRIELKLGLRTSGGRFLARDLALRQVVEILGGAARQRVVAITGATGTGKSTLVERALEELGPDVGIVLFVHARTIAPVLDEACAAAETPQGPDPQALLAQPADGLVLRMCGIVEELLARAGDRPVRQPQWSALDWWERLVGDLARRRCVIALDEVGQIDVLQRGLLRAAVGLWLRELIAQRRESADEPRIEQDLEVLLANVQLLLEDAEQAGQPGVDRRSGGDGLRPPIERRDPLHGLGDGLAQLAEALAGLPPRWREQLAEALGQVLLDVSAPDDAMASMARRSGAVSAPPSFEQRFERLAHQLAGCDDIPTILQLINHLETMRRASVAALQLLVDRRGLIRVALVAPHSLRGFLELDADELFELRLAPMTWSDSWRWIRRSLPGLLRYGEEFLSRQWMRLGARAELWEELERRVIRQRGGTLDLEREVQQIAPPASAAFVNARPAQRWRRGERPLRIAVAGPHLIGPSETAAALTQTAINHGVAGRVVSDGLAEGALAMVVDEPMPFDPDGSISESQVLEWLERLFRSRPDVVLLDYGQEIAINALQAYQREDYQAHLLRGMTHRSLLIGAGGNEGAGAATMPVPGAYSAVLQVGAASAEGVVRRYASWSARLGKPDLFMDDALDNTPLAGALRRPAPSTTAPLRGSSFAALHAVAAAVLAWSLLPTLTPLGVRRLLEAAARPAGRPGQQFLTIDAAVALARQRLVERALRSGPCTLATLNALTGIEPPLLLQTIRALGSRVMLNQAGRLERYEWV